ncbi:MAG: alpha/beta hydrolase [Leptospira sp.]|nr:alpha/beta hydrolase [Leptospira sp.]
MEDWTEWRKSGEFFTYNDLNIYYRVIGEGQPILLIHGYPYNSYDWKDLIEFSNSNPSNYKIKWILLDLPGMGFSDKPKNHIYSFSEYANILIYFVNFLNIKSFDIFAHDLGASVVQELLSKVEMDGLKLDIRSIAFMNGGIFSSVYKPRFIQRLLSQTPNWFGSFLSHRISRKKIESSVLSLFGPETKLSQDRLEEYWQILNYKNGKDIAYLLGRLVFEKPKFQERWIGAMNATNIPLAYICGPYDPNSGIHMAKKFESTVPNGKLYLLSEGIGHWPQIESPSEVWSAYCKFLDLSYT